MEAAGNTGSAINLLSIPLPDITYYPELHWCVDNIHTRAADTLVISL